MSHQSTVLGRHPVAKQPKCCRNSKERGGDREKNPREENSNALPGNSREPATTSPHDISERKCDTPSSNSSEPPFHSVNRSNKKKNESKSHSLASCVSHPRTRSIDLFVHFANALTEINTGRLRHRQLQTHLPVNYPFLTVEKRDITNFSFRMKARKAAKAAMRKLRLHRNLSAIFVQSSVLEIT